MGQTKLNVLFCGWLESTTWVSYKKNLDPTMRGHFIKKGLPRYLSISEPLTLKFFFLLDIVHTVLSLVLLLSYWYHCHLTFQVVLFVGLACLPVMLFLTQLLENVLSKFVKWVKKIFKSQLQRHEWWLHDIWGVGVGGRYFLENLNGNVLLNWNLKSTWW